MKYKMGLVIGRFQPFHKGHAYLLRKALEIAEKITIGIGSSNIFDLNNPFPFEIRKRMIRQFIDAQNIADRIEKVIEIPDVPDDDRWLQLVLDKTGKPDVVIGNNDWVKKIFDKEGIVVITVGHHNRGQWEGHTIRELMRNKEPWEKRVPASVVHSLRLFLQAP